MKPFWFNRWNQEQFWLNGLDQETVLENLSVLLGPSVDPGLPPQLSPSILCSYPPFSHSHPLLIPLHILLPSCPVSSSSPPSNYLAVYNHLQLPIQSILPALMKCTSYYRRWKHYTFNQLLLLIHYFYFLFILICF